MSAALEFAVTHPFWTVAGLMGVGLAGLVGVALIPAATMLVDLGPDEDDE